MNGKTELQKVSEETMRFMRGKYKLDEIGNDKDELEFREKEETIFTIRIHQDCYDFHIDDKYVRVTDLETLESVKQMIMIKKNPNRKPLPKTHIHMSNCGHRCDLCVHYKGKTSFSAEEMEYARECCSAVYGVGDWVKNCEGCHFPDCTVKSAHCRKRKGIDKCWGCENYPICTKTAGWPPEIHMHTITADQVTYAILPYVKGQYGN